MFLKKHLIVHILIVTICLFAIICHADSDTASARYRIFSLNHIDAETATAYLHQLQIGAGSGTISQIAGTDTLLITARSGDLIKASGLLKLVDSEQQYTIAAISPIDQLDIEQLAQMATDLNIVTGTFANPPTEANVNNVIIGYHKGFAIAVASDKTQQQIQDWLTKAKEEKATKEKADAESDIDTKDQADQIEQAELTDRAEQTEEKTSEPDTFTEQLLESIEQAQKEANAIGLADSNDLEHIKQDLIDSQDDQPDQKTESSDSQSDLASEIKEKPAQPAETIAADEKEAKDESLLSQQRSYEPKTFPKEDVTLELELPEKLEIIDLLDLMGKYLDLDYMYNENELKNKSVALRIQDSLTVKELYPFIENVLKFSGFVMSRKGNLVTIVPKEQLLEIDPQMIDTDEGEVTVGDVIITRIFKLKHVDTKTATAMLKGMSLGENIASIDNTSTLIITGYAYRMARIEQFLNLIDVQGKKKIFETRTLKFTAASALVSKVEALASQLAIISVTVATQKASQPQDAQSRRISRSKRKSGRNNDNRPDANASIGASQKNSVFLDSDERTNRILMIGNQEQLVEINKIIDSLDVKQQDLRTIRVYDIQHVGAEDVVDKLGQLNIITPSYSSYNRSSSSSSRTNRNTRDNRNPRDNQSTRNRDNFQQSSASNRAAEEPTDRPQVIIIDSTNSLLVNATAEQHAKITMIIAYVDSEQEINATPYVVYPLENKDPEKLKSMLEELISDTVTTETTGGRKDDKVQRTKTTKSNNEENIKIVADPNSYSLVVYANKRNQKWIGTLIKQLDEYRPQVLLDVTLVEISKDDAFTFNLDLMSAAPDLAQLSPANTLTKLPTEYYKKLMESKDRRFIEGQSASGNFSGFFGDSKIAAILEAVETQKYGRIMAKPKLLVNDNEEGTITAQETVYFAKDSIHYVPTTDPDSAETKNIGVNTKEYVPYNADITLTITPHISTGDNLRLTIALNRTDFRIETSDADDPNRPYDTTTSNVNTVITVPDRYTVILGGLEKMNQSKGGSKVPILGDIPLIGGLFRGVSNKDKQSRLYIFVKANILRPGGTNDISDIKRVSLKNRATFEKYEKEMQDHESWPGIKPEPLDPVRILEDDDE